MKRVAVGVLAGSVVVLVGFVILAWIALAHPFWRPPAVAPLTSGATFSPDLLVELDDGYLAAGVVGTREPDESGRCNGRFALVEVNPLGAPRSAVVATGLERDRWCANEVEQVTEAPSGEWLISGTGRSEPEPSFDDPGQRGERLTLRVSAEGEPRHEFGDGGLLHRAVVIGRLRGELFTDELQSVSEEGAIGGGLLLQPDRTSSTWTEVFAYDDSLVVAVEPRGRALRFQSFEVDEEPLRLRPLRLLAPTGVDPTPNLTVETGNDGGYFEVAGAALHGSTLYVLRSAFEPETLDAFAPRNWVLVAADPRRWHLDRSFGRDGIRALTVTEHAPAALVVDTRDGAVLVAGTRDEGRGRLTLQVLRFSSSGALEWAFERRPAAGREGVVDVLVDDEARAVMLGAGGTLLRLTRAGRIDTSFGDAGIVQLGDVSVCEFEPARSADVCG